MLCAAQDPPGMASGLPEVLLTERDGVENETAKLEYVPAGTDAVAKKADPVLMLARSSVTGVVISCTLPGLRTALVIWSRSDCTVVNVDGVLWATILRFPLVACAIAAGVATEIPVQPLSSSVVTTARPVAKYSISELGLRA